MLFRLMSQVRSWVGSPIQPVRGDKQAHAHDLIVVGEDGFIAPKADCNPTGAVEEVVTATYYQCRVCGEGKSVAFQCRNPQTHEWQYARQVARFKRRAKAYKPWDIDGRTAVI